MKNFLAPLLLSLLLATMVQASSLEIIQLINRPAEEVIPIVEPMLDAGDVITGSGFKIFLRSSPQTLEQVREIIDALDVAAKILRISVYQGSKRNLEAMAVNGNIRFGNDNVEISAGNRDDGAGNIDYSSGNFSGGISASGTELRRSAGPVHQLRIAEGTEGYIETGKQIPYFTSLVRSSSAGSLEFHRATTGFYVLPRIGGDRVFLELSPFKNSPSESGDGSIDIQRASTTISGPVGEWLELGGTSEQFKSSQSGILSRGSAESSREESIWIRADPVR